MKKTFFLLAVVSLTLSFASCKKKCSHPNCTCGDSCLGDSCQCGEKTNDTITETKKSVKTANLYLDNSQSMKGYTEDMTYINVITQLWQAYPDTKVLKCADRYTAIDEKEGSVVDQLRRLAYSSSSLLQNDLKQIISKINEDNIAFYVTDGILSGEANKIDPRRGGDPRWTIKNAASLKIQIQNIFKGAKEKGIGISIYQFNSNFRGRYYCYNNTDNVNINCQRYFYVFAIGKPHALLNFKENFVGQEFFLPKNQMHLIDPMPLKSNIYSSDAQEGNFSKKRLRQKENNKDMIEINVKADPFINNFADNDNKEKTTEIFKSIAEKFIVTVNGNKIEEPGFKVTYDENSNIFKFLLKPRPDNHQMVVSVSAPYELPAWVKLSNFFDENDGDRYMMRNNERDNKTFMLLHLIDGIKQGLLGNGENIFEAQTTFFEN